MILQYEDVDKDKTWDKVQILGPFNTGTNLMHQIIDIAYTAHIGPIGSTIIWKHTICDNANIVDKIGEDVLKIVMVRDPYFWLQSLKGKKRYTLESKAKDINSLMVKSCKLRTHKFQNCAELWNYYYSNYFKFLPKTSTIFVSYEKFIFHPLEVIGVLGNFLKLKEEYNFQKILAIMKRPSNKRARTREEAIEFNSNPKNKIAPFNPSVQRFIRNNLDSSLVERLGYNII